MIELHNVSKSYRAGQGWNRVLDDITVTFPKGKNVGILGLNGAGKSTLLRLIGGVEPPDRGTIRREGRVSWPIAFMGGFPGHLQLMLDSATDFGVFPEKHLTIFTPLP